MMISIIAFGGGTMNSEPRWMRFDLMEGQGLHGLRTRSWEKFYVFGEDREDKIKELTGRWMDGE